MNRLSFIAGILLGLAFSPMIARAQVIGYEPFDYKGSILDASGGVFWDFRQQSTYRFHTRLSSDWDNEPGLPGASICAGGILYTGDSGIIREYGGADLTGEGEGAVNQATFDKKVYYRITMTRGTGTTWCMLSSFDFGTERLQFGLFPGRGVFGIYDLAGFPPIAESGVTVNIGETYTLVAKIDFAADVVSLYVNPNLTGTEASNTPVATGTYTGTHWSTAVRVASGGNGVTAWDDLTVATTWESLRTHEVTTSSNAGLGSLKAAAAAAGATGGRVTFPHAGAYYLIRSGNRLVRVERDKPSVIAKDIAVTGLQPSEKIVAMDFRNETSLGELYMLGITVVSGIANDVGRLYRVNTVTGAASVVGGGPFSTTLPGAANYGFDFYTLVEPFKGPESYIRITQENGMNLRLNPDTGVIDGIDTSLADSGFTSIAHSNFSKGPTLNTLYGFRDSDPRLWRIGGPNGDPSANDGSFTPLLEIKPPTGLRSYDGFDISDDGVGVFSVNDPSGLKIYNLQLDTGVVSQIGLLPPDTNYRGLSVAASRIEAVNLATGPGDTIIDGGSHGGRVRFGFNSTMEMAVEIGEALALRNVTVESADGIIVDGGGVLTASGSTFYHCTAVGAIRGIGSMKLERCTFVENSGNENSAGAVSVFTNARISHCTFVGNRSLGTNPTTDGGGAILNRGGFLTLDRCILAANTSASGIGPDFRNQTINTLANHCVIGDGTNSGITETVANGNDVGTTVTPVLAHLAPLGDYGGATYTMPPLPQSSAINRAPNTSFSGDQRGFLINLAADSGAAEHQGRADLARFWDTDWDNDGSAYGVEQAVGTDPFTSDRSSAKNLRIVMSSGDPILTFGIENNARPHSRWVVKRSADLLDFSEQIYSFDGPTSTNTTASGIFQGSSGPLLLIRDQAPNPPKMFYRLEVLLRP
jgi:Domain of unknown function (DUF4394)